MQSHRVRVGDQERELKVVNVGAVSVALLNLLGDTALTEAAADELVRRLPHGVQTLVTPEVKAVPLAHAMSVRSGLPYVVARKTEKPYMVDSITRSVMSITTGKPQLLVIDGADLHKLRGKRVAIVDDVVSTGGTLNGLIGILEEVGAEVVATMVVFTEGSEREDVIALGHLPLYPAEQGAHD
ncbi:MAG: phosphoribosyltransferase family protein [Trueperaceae bacterium]|jgi:adenine phosphoribosyltransferase|nr:phosphoribosyltransferase family protein [Truepera sp.]HRN18018.1 phosphoribosyltransferase family protein [Trueperaceae bacterium]HRQ10383.1 phosphoribosyltransferase family protein [Trueperaceae bacterium]